MLNKWISPITSIAALITSISVLLTIPNSVRDYFKMRHWEDNLQIVRISSQDYTVIYNANPRPVFFSHLTSITKELDTAGIVEINQIIPANDYLVINNDKEKIKWDKILSYSYMDILVVKNKGLDKEGSPYKLVYYDSNHNIVEFFKKYNVQPRYFDTELRLYFDADGTRKEMSIPAKAIVVDTSKP